MTADRYVVLGNPVAHSKSPQIHAQFAQQTGDDIDYQPRLVEAGTFNDVIAGLQSQGYRGANVTVPFKQEAFAITDEPSERARVAEAVNTLQFRQDGSIYGDNTDGEGLVADMANHGVRIAGRHLLVLGAGGAARGIIAPLVEQRPESVTIVNRTVAKAQEITDRLGTGVPVNACGYEQLNGKRYDIIINATSLGLNGELVPLPDDILNHNGVAYDLVYGEASVPFLQWARAHGASLALDGLGMLVEQAAASYRLWRGKRPQTAPVIEALRKGS